MKKLNLVFIYSFILSFFIVLAIFTISRQFPLNILGLEGIPKYLVSLVFISSLPFILKNIFNGKKDVTILTIFITILISIHSYYSLFIVCNPSGTLRFYLILLFVLFAYHVHLRKFVIDWFIFANIIQSLFLLLFELYLVFVASQPEISQIRHYFLTNLIGDVYSYDGFFYKIQMLGNPLIPFSFFISIFLRKKMIINLILLIGVIISANLAFYIATALFLLFFIVSRVKNNIQLINNLIKVSFIILICFFPVIFYLKYILSKKAYSLGVRADQLNVLISDMSTSWITVILGKGLGNLINVSTPLRDYSTYGYYFELQTIYIFNQMGILALIYYAIIIYIAYRLYNWKLFFIYLFYIMYAVTNPYIFDTIHIIVILILNIIQREYYEKNIRNSNYV